MSTVRIQRRNDLNRNVCGRNMYAYGISIALGGLLALSLFAINDFYFYHVKGPNGPACSSTINQMLHQMLYDRDFNHKLAQIIPEANVAKATNVIYEMIFLLWVTERADKALQSMIAGGAVGAVCLTAGRRVKLMTVNKRS